MSYSTRIALIGKTGVGKSACGNTILGYRAFQSTSSGTSVTDICQLRDGMAHGRSISVVDTPGFLDTRTKDQDQILKEIARCIYLCAPGPHAICFVFPIGRFTTEDIDTIKAFVRLFGEALYQYVIVIFTKFDDYKRDNPGNCTINSYIKTLPAPALEFIEKFCGSRVIGFDNTFELSGNESRKQFSDLLSTIENMVGKNGGACYTNDDFKRAENVIEEEMKRESDRLKLEKEQTLKRLQEKIDKAADKKAKTEIKTKMDAYKAEMERKMSNENLHKKAQESEDGFDKFSKIVKAVSPIVKTIAEVIKTAISKEKHESPS